MYDKGAKKTALQQARNSGNPQQKNTKSCAEETVAIEHSMQEQSRDRDQHQTSENHQKTRIKRISKEAIPRIPTPLIEKARGNLQSL